MEILNREALRHRGAACHATVFPPSRDAEQPRKNSAVEERAQGVDQPDF
ncbi:UNVERIFIED_ORG: hypothetical protein GGI57_003697 [Rhizobium aethiopicum]|nr:MULTISPECIES: hypothetical protein [Rhizobium]